MDLMIEKVKGFKELSYFLSEINQRKDSHIGYCGQNREEIYQTLNEDFIDEDGNIPFFIARNNIGEIQAAIGLDVDGPYAEVWGPFNLTTSVDLQYDLWEKLINANSIVESVQFFMNEENIKQQMFVKEIGAIKTGEHLNLELKKQNIAAVSKKISTPFAQEDFLAFQKLHNETFPNTYYDARTIRKRLSNKNILNVIKTESNELIGYAYYEVDIDMADASLEYIGIANSFQNKGFGTLMLKEVLTEMFSYPHINEINLTVNNTNKQANHVYMKAGFEPKDILISYELKL